MPFGRGRWSWRCDCFRSGALPFPCRMGFPGGLACMHAWAMATHGWAACVLFCAACHPEPGVKGCADLVCAILPATGRSQGRAKLSVSRLLLRHGPARLLVFPEGGEQTPPTGGRVPMPGVEGVILFQGRVCRINCKSFHLYLGLNAKCGWSVDRRLGFSASLSPRS